MPHANRGVGTWVILTKYVSCQFCFYVPKRVLIRPKNLLRSMVTPPLSFREPGQDADQEKYSIFRPLCFRLSISTLIYAMVHTVCLNEGGQNFFSCLAYWFKNSVILSVRNSFFSQITENFRDITEIAEGIIWSQGQGFFTLLYNKRSFN